MSTLATNGLPETRHGIRTTAHAVTREEVVRPLTLFLRTCGQEVSLEHLHQVRSIPEVKNAGQASDVDIEGFRRICAAALRIAARLPGTHSEIPPERGTEAQPGRKGTSGRISGIEDCHPAMPVAGQAFVFTQKRCDDPRIAGPSPTWAPPRSPKSPSGRDSDRCACRHDARRSHPSSGKRAPGGHPA